MLGVVVHRQSLDYRPAYLLRAFELLLRKEREIEDVEHQEEDNDLAVRDRDWG